MAHAFDAGADFAEDKAADTPCRHLGAGGLCTIHASRAERGYGGCIAYHCHGAGQYVTRVMFGGADWQTDPARLAPMTAAFRELLPVQRWRAMLETATALDLSGDLAAELDALRAALLPPPGEVWTAEALAALRRGPLEARIGAFLRALRGTVPAPRTASEAVSPETLR
ncbi:hypothetical protein EAT49_05925 [Histidinibacterium lentulum]|uniref:Pentapeptide repeat-containing protein n=1 Tax=Histidinibacterium lentulum TaxID=2480588 RepID=A0A3N2R5S5_9RHOB|nr:hypothetical protein EAT49_05925 [Histidinibacterium lentulum]